MIYCDSPVHQAETEDIKETDYKLLFCCFLEKLWRVEKASISITAKIKEDFCNAKKEQSLRNTVGFIFFKQCLQLGDCCLNPPNPHNESCKKPTFVYHSVSKHGLVFFLFHFAIHMLELRDWIIIKQYVHRKTWFVCLLFHVTLLFLNSILFHTSSAVGKGVQMNFSILQQHKNPDIPSHYKQLLKVFNFHTHTGWLDVYYFCTPGWPLTVYSAETRRIIKWLFLKKTILLNFFITLAFYN